MELAADLAEARGAARSERLLVLPAKIRLRPGWLEALARHMRGGGGDAVIEGEAGFLQAKPYGLVLDRSVAAGLARPDLKGLRGKLARGAVRLS